MLRTLHCDKLPSAASLALAGLVATVAGVEQVAADAVFDGSILSLDRVNVEAQGVFQVTFQLQGDELDLLSAEPVAETSPTESPDASFETASSILSIPQLDFAGDRFHVLLQLNAGTGRFNVLSFVPLGPVSVDVYGKNRNNTASSLAVNIAPFAAWTPGWVLIDLFPKSQAWVSNECNSFEWNSGPELQLDSKGWVTSLPENICADTSVLASQPGHYPSGTYVLLWEGDGIIEARWDVEPQVSSADAEVSQSSGLQRMTFDVFAGNQTDLGIGIRLSALGSDPLRNIRLLPPGGLCGRSETELNYFAYCATNRGGTGVCPVNEQCFDFEQVFWDRFRDDPGSMNTPKPVFHPLYASTYQQYGAIRFMKWLRPEDSLDVEWSDRITVDMQPFTLDEKGLPAEYALAFANLINADAWLTMPMASSDSYNREFARLVNTQLHSGLDIYLEYGNEIFNSEQAVPFGYAVEQANVTAGIPSSDTDLVKAAKFAGHRSAEIFNLWNDELDDPTRMTTVLVGFNPLQDYTLNVLDFDQAYQLADALAINGYIGPHRSFIDDQAAFDALTVDALLQELDDGSVLNSGTSLPDLHSQYQQHAQIAQQRGLRLLAYEGNNFMATTGGPDNVVATFFAANRDSRLGERFVSNLENFRSAGGDEFFHFLNEDLWNDNGVFGARQYQDQTREQAPVFDALMDFIENNPCWWAACLQPPPP